MKSHLRPHIGGRYRVTDSRSRVFEGIVRSADNQRADLEVTAGKEHYWKSVDTKIGDLITVEISRCTFELL